MLAPEAADHPETFMRRLRDKAAVLHRLLVIVEDCDNTPSVDTKELEPFLASLSAFIGDGIVLLLTYVNSPDALACKVRAALRRCACCVLPTPPALVCGLAFQTVQLDVMSPLDSARLFVNRAPRAISEFTFPRRLDPFVALSESPIVSALGRHSRADLGKQCFLSFVATLRITDLRVILHLQGDTPAWCVPCPAGWIPRIL
jgi:hypothetical protein